MELLRKFSLTIILTSFFQGTFSQEMLFEFEGPQQIKSKGYISVKISFVNRSNDILEFYHPGIIYGSLTGSYFRGYPLFNFGLFHNDSLLPWGGNCVPFARPNKYYWIKNGKFLICSEKLIQSKNEIISLKPDQKYSINTLLNIHDCYPLERGEIYKISISYSHVKNYKPGIENDTCINFMYRCEDSFEFKYKGK